MILATKDFISNCRYLKKKIRNHKCNDYKNQKKQLENNYIDICINLIFELKADLIKVSSGFVILENFFTDSVIYYTSTYNEMYYNYKEKIEDIKNKTPNAKGVYSLWVKCFNTYKEVALLQEQYVKIFSTLKHNLKNFQGHRTTKKGDKYKRVFQLPLTATLPANKIEYTNDFGKLYEIISYTYEVKTLEDLFNISIYQLSLQKNFIIRCKYCHKYSITNRKNKIYCNKNCVSAFSLKKSKENESKAATYYSTLSNKYRHTKAYKKANEELKLIHNQYKTKQIDDETFENMLLDLEKKVKATCIVKRGRPPKKKQ